MDPFVRAPVRQAASSSRWMSIAAVVTFLAISIFNFVFSPLPPSSIDSGYVGGEVVDTLSDHRTSYGAHESGYGRSSSMGVHSGRNVHVVTILTEPRKYHCTMLASAAFNNITVHVFGWGDTKLHGTVGWWRKLLWFKTIASSFAPDDLVLFVDAGDTLFNAGVDQILRAYEETVHDQNIAPNNEFVWSAERNCGMKTLTKKDCDTLHDVPAGEKYRWLNTGGWMGRSKVAKFIFEQSDEVREGRTNDADQSFVALAHARKGWKKLHGIDYKQSVFMSVYLGHRDICGWGTPGGLVRPLQNCVTKSRPTIFHFNAGAKDARIFDKVKAAMWWGAQLETDAGKELVGNHEVVLEDGRRVKTKEFCPTGYGLVADHEVRSVRNMIHI